MPTTRLSVTGVRGTVAAIKPLAIPRPHPYTPAELANMRQQFNMLDTEGHQVLDRDEMYAFAKLHNMNPHLIDLAFLLFDRKQRGRLSFDAFVEFLAIAQENTHVLYRRIFDALDPQCTNEVTADQLVFFSSVVGQPLTLADVQAVIRSIDSTRSGRLRFDDLCGWFSLSSS
jgi:Ca2+-binding EF-hand superfamily protein